MPDPTCDTCRHWHATHVDRGECRRHAPPALVVDAGKRPAELVVLWPPVPASGSCGDWQHAGPHPLTWTIDDFADRSHMGLWARKACRRAGETVADLVRLTSKELRVLPGAKNKTVGPRTIREIRLKLAEYGLRLRGDPRPKPRES